MITERFAPSPTGLLHLGHAFSALTAWDAAVAARGDFLLRIEDIDQSRARTEWEAQIFADLRWLGITWPEPVMRQSRQIASYRRALETLWNKHLLYICTCSRRDIEAALSAPQEGLATGPDGLIYPGTCRGMNQQSPRRKLPQNAVLRLDMAAAIDILYKTNEPPEILFTELGTGTDGETGEISVQTKELIHDCGDVVLARHGMGTSYHLSVVVDDAAQGITHVTRGQDLFEATKIHVVLQKLLGLPTPAYRHHRLIRDEDGKRLAKRDDARAISKYRADGASPEDVRRMAGLL